MKKLNPIYSDFSICIDNRRAWHDCDAETASTVSDGIGAVMLGFSNIGGRKMKKGNVVQFGIVGRNYRDWYTVVKIAEGRFSVSRQGTGDSESYETTKKGFEALKALATSEII